jgi:KipI family sensor histidine kinase inhibitor
MGHSALLVPSTDPIALWTRLRAEPPEAVVEVVAGAESVLLVFDSAAPAEPPLLPAPSASDPGGRLVEIPVAYDGPDLADVAELAGLKIPDVARRHSSPDYSVDFIGFSPGFAYLSGLDPRLDVPRLARPRTSVPAGSVAVAAGLTAVYPQSTPGGWRLIGRTDRALFDPRRDPPAQLEPGDRVRFVRSARVGPYPSWPAPSLVPGGSGGPRVVVLGVGARMTVQDLGRSGWAHAGVPRAGVADRASAAFANALVGNPADRALFEVTLGGGHIRVMSPCLIAVTGARCDLLVDGLPARLETPLPLPAGTEIHLGPALSGVHTYLAVSGGLDVEPVLGSRSCDTLSGLGPPPLRAGDVLGIGDAGGLPSPPAERPPPVPEPGAEVTVRALAGPFSSGRSSLATSAWEVSPDSDRTGARLTGPVLGTVGPVASMGMVPGAVQVPPGGQPVVLLRNHPPTGGYPVVAVVDDAGVDLLAQCRPGTRIRFDFSR